MAILGGVIPPPMLGIIADLTGSLQVLYIVPLVAYTYVAFYGALGHKSDARTQAPEKSIECGDFAVDFKPFHQEPRPLHKESTVVTLTHDEALVVLMKPRPLGLTSFAPVIVLP